MSTLFIFITILLILLHAIVKEVRSIKNQVNLQYIPKQTNCNGLILRAGYSVINGSHLDDILTESNCLKRVVSITLTNISPDIFMRSI